MPGPTTLFIEFLIKDTSQDCYRLATDERAAPVAGNEAVALLRTGLFPRGVVCPPPQLGQGSVSRSSVHDLLNLWLLIFLEKTDFH